MTNYSDLIFLIGAIAIYGLLVTNTTRTMALNNQTLTSADVEYRAISVAENVLDKARWIKYDEISISKLKNLESNSSVDWYSTNFEIHPPDNGCPSSNPCKQIDVKVTSPYLQNSDAITLSLIKTKYKSDKE